ncbi:hypothetical protein GCM10009525_21530 [Streptosporangium amethystogenes subsp. fukuiense]
MGDAVPRRSALLLGPLSAISALLLTVAMPQPAQAYTQQHQVTVERGASFCARATAGIDHRVPGTLSGNQAWARAYALAGDCTTVHGARARVRLEVQKWNASRAAWEVCAAASWVEGTTGRDQFGLTGPSVGLTYTPCGPGWRQTKAEAQSYRYVDSAGRFLWFGGTLYSGYEWVD